QEVQLHLLIGQLVRETGTPVGSVIADFPADDAADGPAGRVTRQPAQAVVSIDLRARAVVLQLGGAELREVEERDRLERVRQTGGHAAPVKGELAAGIPLEAGALYWQQVQRQLEPAVPDLRTIEDQLRKAGGRNHRLLQQQVLDALLINRDFEVGAPLEQRGV